MKTHDEMIHKLPDSMVDIRDRTANEYVDIEWYTDALKTLFKNGFNQGYIEGNNSSKKEIRNLRAALYSIIGKNKADASVKALKERDENP